MCNLSNSEAGFVSSQQRHHVANSNVVVQCPCGNNYSIEKVYRCFFCEVWFCRNCCIGHFGSKKDWEAAKETGDPMPPSCIRGGP